MKKMTMMATGALMLGIAGASAYLLSNKKAKKKASKLLDNALDDASSYFTKNN